MGVKIEIKDVSFAYKESQEQLKNINLVVEEGETVLFTGPSGCGKTTMTRLINGLIPHFFDGELSGEIFVDGENVKEMKMWERSRKIGNVFQDPRSQFFTNEVAGEIAFGCENFGLSHEIICSNVNNAAKKTGITNLLERKLTGLSYGERQKVAITSARATNPDIYVMDEPSANLDMDSTGQFGQLLEELKNEGKTIIIAEHRLYYLLDIADRIVYMENGRIKEIFSPEQIRTLPEERLYKMGLRAPDLSVLQVPAHSMNKQLEEGLKLESVCASISRIKLLNEISFAADNGEVIAIVGPNGAGKSSLGRLLAGLLKERSGQVLLNDIQHKTKARRGKVWYVMQDLDSQLFGESLVDELLIGCNSKSREKETEKAEKILNKLGLGEFKDQHPQRLSGGQKQRLVLGVALMRDVQILILDEPTSGLDGKNMLRVADIMRQLAKEGRLVLIITHDYELAVNACDRVIYIEKGTVITDKSLNRFSYPALLMSENNYKPWITEIKTSARLAIFVILVFLYV